MTAPSPLLTGTPDSNTVLTHAVRSIVPADAHDILDTDAYLELVVSTTAAVMAAAAWQLQEFVDFAESQESLEGLTKLVVPFHPSWADIAAWLQRARDKGELTAKRVQNSE